jgi:chemotaxis signal transduction protein
MDEGGDAKPFIVISAGGRRKLVPLEAVVELVPMLALAEVEGPRGACRGMANLRGEIVPVFDATSPTAPLHPSRFIVIARAESLLLGLVVDDVYDIVTVGPGDLASRPIGGGRSAVMARVEETLLPVIDLPRVVDDNV